MGPIQPLEEEWRKKKNAHLIVVTSIGEAMDPLGPQAPKDVAKADCKPTGHMLILSSLTLMFILSWSSLSLLHISVLLRNMQMPVCVLNQKTQVS